MLNVEKVVLQIMDGAADLCALSQREMPLIDAPEARALLEKHIDRMLADPAGRPGQFWADSGFAATLQRYNIGEIPFAEFAAIVGDACYGAFRQLDKAEAADLVLVQFSREERSYVALLLMSHRTAWTHTALTQEGALTNQLMQHQAILPGGSQRLDSWAVVDRFSFDAIYTEKKRSMDRQPFELLRQAVLQLDAVPSAKETVKAVQQIAAEIAAGQDLSPVQTATRVKASLARQGQLNEEFVPLEAAREVFAEAEDPEPLIREFEQRVQEAGLPPQVRVEPAYAVRTARTHRIRTDTGIELVVPAEYFDDPNIIRFVNNPDGTLSIQIDQIGSIENK